MKKFFVILFLVILLLTALLVVGLVSSQDVGVKWLSDEFTETLKEKNELIVYSAEQTGRKIRQQNAYILGTVQEVTIPYTFSFDYSVDLSKAVVEVNGRTIYVHIPGPRLCNYKLSINDNEVELKGIYRLDANKYTAYKKELENELLTDVQANEQYNTDAWNVAVHNLTSLLQSVAKANAVDGGFTIEVIRDDTLLYAENTSTAVPIDLSTEAPATTAIPAAQ